ncbi:hypothetical protein CTA2_9607 [Colletotrichum tanaceti]|uniref:Uncharacterized protein n=1 Tax=Colletotrichum tanaceti TaxID=1306861 RepID=A0A4U6XEB0_9PEZI|nr:hypothetical protein CTA2_9607 [Colletotrichum tanaceti]TKW52217.1 hypothetical protein CTA1_12848 [Colletotrichum tanaceti]
MAPAHEVVADHGYQTPDENNRPSYFAQANDTLSTSFQSPKSPLRRPPFSPQSSYGLALESGDGALPSVERRAASNESSPDNAKASKENRSRFQKTMATGGMANVIHSLPYQAAWLNGIAVAFFLLNVILFVMNCVLAGFRFKLRPGTLTHSFTDQTESLFIPSSVVSLAIISINICQFGVPNPFVPLPLKERDA